MTSPAGWYPDPEQPGQQRWWTGVGWGGQRVPAAVPAPPATVPPAAGASRTRHLGPLHIVLLSLVGALLLVSAVGGAFWAMLALVALVAVVIGAVALVRGRVSSLGIRNRGMAAAVIGAALCLVVVGGGANAAIHPVAPRPAALLSAPEGTSAAEPSATPTPTPTDVVTEVTEVVEIPFAVTEVQDPDLDVGQVVVTTAGVPGQQTNTYRVTTRAGIEIARELVAQLVSVQPIAQVTSVGTRQPAPPPPPAPVAEPAGGGCDPNYEGQCVPIASDVDCAGGSGNGPAYTPGPVYVVGSDVYDLDRDGDGIACDA
ncbi:G5 domain-containing protein [Plantibacter flavus]|uniref:G5 domain-containing protein n=1 Tax=Plantibacter flavus TaxID=150123 RepID=UPI0012946AE6|nr:G5 domain-containing protein [Plantibacter flavus]